MKQIQALKVLNSGKNVFLTGSPGSGKTYVLNKFVAKAKSSGKKVAVTATTGIAATHLSGTTIHSWSGIGISGSLEELDLKKLKANSNLVKRYKTTDILVIDEVSMLDGKRLDLISGLAKIFRKNDQVFGGLQVVLVGDLFQLPPVSRDRSDFDFVYKADCWDQLDLSVCYLTEQHRQKEDDGFNEILEGIRVGKLSPNQLNTLKSRKISPSEEQSLTKLYAHNYDVDQMNEAKLKSLPSEEHVYEMSTSGLAHDTKRLVSSILAPERLALKEDCEVMFVVNNQKLGFYNGTRGRVVDFNNGVPVVRLSDDRYIEVRMHDWHVEINNEVIASASQLPLRLAWAITIHKSQGMSLEAAEVDLSHAFTPGMGYVALSRLQSLSGLYLKDMNRLALVVNRDILEKDKDFRLQSASQEL
ncbi:MAG TPA: PIF1 family DEAD/DEAH box helicase [Candidatus Saccharimonadales bacterium]